MKKPTPPTPNKGTSPIVLRVRDCLRERMENVMTQEGLHTSEFVRRAILNEVSRFERQQK